MSEDTKPIEVPDIASKEQERLILKLVSNQAKMAADYKNTIKRTGGLLTTSMTFAYAKGLQDALKLLTKDTTNESV
jgi:hypothetical protein